LLWCLWTADFLFFAFLSAHAIADRMLATIASELPEALFFFDNSTSVSGQISPALICWTSRTAILIRLPSASLSALATLSRQRQLVGQACLR
jgi:hypothetical protein